MITGLPSFNAYLINAQPGETVPLSVTGTTGNVEFFFPSSAVTSDVMITNAGTKTAFFNFGNVAGTTATVPGTTGTNTSTPILAGAILSIQKNTNGQQNNYCAAICNGIDTTLLYFTAIEGS